MPVPVVRRFYFGMGGAFLMLEIAKENHVWPDDAMESDAVAMARMWPFMTGPSASAF